MKYLIIFIKFSPLDKKKLVISSLMHNGGYIDNNHIAGNSIIDPNFCYAFQMSTFLITIIFIIHNGMSVFGVFLWWYDSNINNKNVIIIISFVALAVCLTKYSTTVQFNHIFNDFFLILYE